MLPLDQVFLKVFQADEPVATDALVSGVSTHADSDCEQKSVQGQEPQTINFPETPAPAPQVIAFEQQGRKTKETTSDATDSDKDHGRFAEDFCPSRRFRKLYILHRDEHANVTEVTSSDVTSKEQQSEPISRRNIQEQALRLLVENGAGEPATDPSDTCLTAKVFDSEEQHIIPIDRESTPLSSVDETAVESVAVDTEEIQEQEEHIDTAANTQTNQSTDTDSVTENQLDADTSPDELPLSTLPLPSGTMPRVCRQMLGRAKEELGGIGNVLEKTIRAGHKIVGFKGTGRKCGSSTLLLGAAGELALRGWKVLVVDGSFDHPSLASSLELKTETGWDDAIFRKAPLESAMVRISVTADNHRENTSDHTASFCFLPLMPETVSRAIVASCKKDWLNKILDLSDRFDLVLVDTGSYGPDSLEEKVQEMLRFGVDGFFLVKDTRNRVNTFIPELVDQIRKVDLVCLGIIENFI